MDDPQLQKQVELARKAVWEVIGQLTGRGENTAAGGVGLHLRLKWSHNELKQTLQRAKYRLGSTRNRCCRGSVRVASLVGT
jgi:hypothetical protein